MKYTEGALGWPLAGLDMWRTVKVNPAEPADYGLLYCAVSDVILLVFR